MIHPFCEFAQPLVKELLEANGESLRWLSKQTGVPYHRIYRMNSGELATLSYYDAKILVRFLRVNDPDLVLQQYYPAEKAKDKRSVMDDEGERQDLLQLELQSEQHWRVGKEVASREACTVDDIQTEFGRHGLKLVDELTALGVLSNDNGHLRSNISRERFPASETAKQEAKMHIDMGNIEGRGSLLWNEQKRYNLKGRIKIYNLIHDTEMKAREIDADPENIGDTSDELFVYTLFLAPLRGGVFDVDQVAGQNFETRVNNYKKAYDLDLQTAKKVAMVAHDMRGPLGYIENYMDMLSARDRSEEDFHLARSAMKRINSMLNSFKDLKAEAVIVREKGWLYFDECKDLCESYSRQYCKDFEFLGSLEFDADLDAEKVDRALQNLMTNAFEAARTAVRVEVFRQDAELVMIVSDNGPGVPEENLPKLFKKGFTEGKDNGTGLGLTFVKHVADGHGGTIDYLRTEDGWTQFKLIIPHVFFDEMLDTTSEARPIAVDNFLHIEESEEEMLRRPLKKQEDPDKKRRLAEICTQKPILLVLIDWPHWTSEKHRHLQQLLPDYEISDTHEDVERAWLICLDSEDRYYDYIMDHRLNAVWIPDSFTRSSPSLVERLWGMGEQELKKFRVTKQQTLASQTIETD